MIYWYNQYLINILSCKIQHHFVVSQELIFCSQFTIFVKMGVLLLHFVSPSVRQSVSPSVRQSVIDTNRIAVALWVPLLNDKCYHLWIGSNRATAYTGFFWICLRTGYMYGGEMSPTNSPFYLIWYQDAIALFIKKKVTLRLCHTSYIYFLCQHLF